MPCPPADSLNDALADLRARGVTTVLSMLSPDEAADLGMVQEDEACAAQSMTFVGHPIPDFGLPEMFAFKNLIAAIVARIRDGEHVAVHCRAGIGRSGMVAASTLIALGQSHDTARDIVSGVRGVSIPDTVEQATFLALFENAVKHDVQISD
ncbi:protein-tyrosine phosphatase family protein [Sulfitobacter noctilucicola]|uniref:protein-tyrosine phosphatase family protein n=1 Tax=Sulfitobacter noctilucicola TaxID=1342301 RepID=UPI0035D47E7E